MPLTVQLLRFSLRVRGLKQVFVETLLSSSLIFDYFFPLETLEGSISQDISLYMHPGRY